MHAHTHTSRTAGITPRCCTALRCRLPRPATHPSTHPPTPSIQPSSSGPQVKKTTQLRKLINAYASKQGLDPGSIVFMFDGTRLREEQTPADHDMEDNDVIDVLLHQVGGRRQ